MPASIKPPPLEQVGYADFSGGLNLRDAPSQLADNETPDAMNVSLDERGGAVSRLGKIAKNSVALPGVPSMIWYWPSQQIVLFQVGATLYKTTDEFSTWTPIAVLTSSAKAAFVDFQGKAVVAHRNDGVFTYDGTTWALANATVKGNCIAAWQNKVWVGSAVDATVWWSNAGNPALWTLSTDLNQLREKDNQPITAIGVGAGQDATGKPGLFVFKEQSVYRLNDSTTGQYVTLDVAAGAVGPNALTTLFGKTVFFARSGIYSLDSSQSYYGIAAPELISSKIQPVFDDQQLNFGNLAGVAAGVYRDRIVFSVPWGSAQATNNRTFEFHPLQGWIVMHDFGAAAFATFAKNKQRLWGCSPTATKIYEHFSSGSDAGAAITARIKTKAFKTAEGYECSFRHLRLWGRGTFSCYTILDYDQGVGELNDVNLQGDAFVWNDAAAVWNAPAMIWGPTVYEGEIDFYSIGWGRVVQFNFTHTGTSSATGQRLLDDGAAPEVGSFGVYGFELEFVVLGNA